MVRTRFSPSPTGVLHLGSIYQVLFDYAYAKKNSGKFIVRIEDTDQKRYLEGAEEKVYEALCWLGITPDEGPKYGGDFGPYRQSERLDIYRKYAEKLVEEERAYYCFCSEERLEEVRKNCAKEKKPPKYDQCCRKLPLEEAKARIAKGEKAVIRMKVWENEKIIVNDLVRGIITFDSCQIDDQIILKSDGFPTYHLAVVVDDHLMEITHVVRGQEWLPSFPKHILLYRYFGWEPPVFLHTPVILDPEGGKLSKRKSNTSLFWFKENGFFPEALLNFLATLGWSHPEEKDIFSLEEFVKLFELSDVSPVAPIFDIKKLEWLNGEYIRTKSDTDLAECLKPFLPQLTEEQIAKAAPLVKERIKKLIEAKEMLEFVVSCPAIPKELLLQRGTSGEMATDMLSKTAKIVENIGVDDFPRLQGEILTLIKENNWNTGAYFMVLRVAVCAKPVTPPIVESLALIGKEETLLRLKTAGGCLK